MALLLGLVRDLGLSILVVTHNLGLAWNIADRLAVMYLGRIVEQGPTEAVLDSPATPTPGPCCRWSPRSATSTSRSWPARRPTRPGSRTAAASTPAARPWPRAQPRRRASRPLPHRAAADSVERGRAARRLLPD